MTKSFLAESQKNPVDALTLRIRKVFMRNKIAPKSLHLVFGHSEKLFDRYVDVPPWCYKWKIGLDGMVNRAKVSIEHFYGPTNGGQLQKHIYEHDLTLLQLFLSLKSLKLKGRNITQQAERILMNVECPPSPFLMWCA